MRVLSLVLFSLFTGLVIFLLIHDSPEHKKSIRKKDNLPDQESDSIDTNTNTDSPKL